MTEHVRSNYRKHRKATWGFAIALMVAIAAVVIPIASGASDKTYTMLFPAGAVTPAPPVSGNTTSQTLCSNSDYTVKVAITNTAKSVQLGSADVTFPANVTLSGATFPAGSPAAWQISRSGQGRLASAALASEGRHGHDCRCSPHRWIGVSSRQSIIAKVKQSNDFSDTGGDANTFSNPTFPTISVQVCAATITGRVYHDRDQSGSFAIADPNNPSPTSDIAKQGWKVTLWQKTPQNTYAKVDQELSDANGMYSVTGPIGKDSLLCATPNADDSTTSWGVRAVAGVTLADGCQASDAAKGLSVHTSAQRGEDRAGLRSRSDHDAGLRPRRHGDRRELHRHGRRQRGRGPAALRAGDVDRQRPPVLRVRADQRLHGLPRQDLPARADVRLGPAERSRADPPGRARLRRHRAVPEFNPMPYCLQDPRVNWTPPITLLEDRRPSGRRNLVHRGRASDGLGRRYGRECIGQLQIHRLHVLRRSPGGGLTRLP